MQDGQKMEVPVIGMEDLEPFVFIKGQDGDYERLLRFLLVDKLDRLKEITSEHMTEIAEGQAPYNTKIDDDGSATTSGTGTSDDTVSCCASEWVDDDLNLDDLPTLSANDIPDSISDTSGTVAVTEKAKKKNETDPYDTYDDSVPGSPSNTAATIAQAEEAYNASFSFSKTQAEVANNASFSFSKQNTSHASRITG
jgi:hypothetical protein